MRNRIWFSIRFEQLKRISPIIYFFMQNATLALVLYSMIDWKTTTSGWFLLPIIFIIITFFAFGFAWAYYDLFKMRIPEQEARFNMEPAYSNLLSPKEAWLYDTLSRAIRGDETAHASLIKASEMMRIPDEEMNGEIENNEH